ncbi:leucyl aminopeptidase [Arthrobacter gengyunqii]|uniref:Probable cytosol aminopeptidase n=1 Tax=Arthrobacter gengyunqii TaxID=2886940 RepID=A0A9X1S736_9MICC|nr:leucyl aminopeptidase [Arthrobacter gengyunqii]MCC3270523.1 leucyl aminopeptidase [Arthrobacter gengyunqii]UOY97429.1 leucyl aminopeptidase [Arthrobacter gengyunqii]
MVKTNEPTLTVISKDVQKVPAQALVVGIGQTPGGPVLIDSPLSSKAASALAASLPLLGVTGAADEIHRLPGLPELEAQTLVLAGVGKVEAGVPLSSEALRRAAGSAVRQLAGTESVALALPAATVADAAAVAEGALFGAYGYSEHRTDKAKVKEPVTTITVISPAADDKALKAAVERARILGRAVNATRTLVNQPPSHLYPETFAAAAKDLAKPLSAKVKVTVMDEKKLERDGFGGLMGVGKGSSRPPRMVKVEYAPQRAKAKLALVGKGITFDSGGLSLKPAAGMQTMKCDMGGAAVVLNALLAIAELGLPVKVTAWLCLAENMPSGTAQRPGDVMTTYGGRTVEVLNTDAEGRLVMADGLVAASEEAPDVLIDVATLTGAQMIALGNRVSAVMGEEGVRDAVKAAADRAGELFWPMPIPEELRASLDSQVADIANHGERFGGMMTAATFLREFVGEVDGVKIPWAHLDIAGPAFNEGSPYGYTPKEGTGVAVRTLVAYAEDVVARSV